MNPAESDDSLPHPPDAGTRFAAGAPCPAIPSLLQWNCSSQLAVSELLGASPKSA